MTESAVVESLFSDSGQSEWAESNRRFYRTLNEIRIRQGVPPISHPSLQIENQENQRSVFVKIQFEKYAISDEVLYQLFSGFGVIENIERFDSPMGFHSQIRFQHKASAIQAFRDIYDNCCQLELLLVEEIETEPSNSTEDELAQIAQDSSRKFDQKFEVFSDLVLSKPVVELVDDSKHAIETIAPIVQDAAETLDGSHQSAFELPRSVRQKHKEGLESSMARQGTEIVEEFNKIEQEDDLDEYNEKFEDLRVGMLAYNPDLPEMYFVTSYIRGLRPEVRLLVKIGRPESLAAALKLSQLHNKGVQAMLRISKNPWRTLDSETQFVEDEALEFTQGGENPGVDRRLIDDGEYGKDLAHNEEIADSFEVLNQEIKEVPDDDREKRPNQQRTFKVNRKPSKSLIYGGEINWLAELVILLIELMEIRLANSRIDSFDCWRNISALKVFVKMPRREFELVTRVMVEACCSYHHRLESRAFNLYKSITWPFDKGRASIRLDVLIESCSSLIVGPGQTGDKTRLVFDPGGMCHMGSVKNAMFLEGLLFFDIEGVATELVKAYSLIDCILVFDPGG